MNPSQWEGRDLVVVLCYTTPRDETDDWSRTIALNRAMVQHRLIFPTGVLLGGLSPKKIAAAVVEKQIHMNGPESQMEQTFQTDMFPRFGRVHLIRIESRSRISFQDYGHRRCVSLKKIFDEKTALPHWQASLLKAAMEAVPEPA